MRRAVVVVVFVDVAALDVVVVGVVVVGVTLVVVIGCADTPRCSPGWRLCLLQTCSWAARAAGKQVSIRRGRVIISCRPRLAAAQSPAGRINDPFKGSWNCGGPKRCGPCPLYRGVRVHK